MYLAPTARAGLAQLAQSSLPAANPSSALLQTVPRVAAAVAIFVAAWGAGRALLRAPLARRALAPPPGRLLGALTETALGLGALSLFALALSPLGLLRPAALIVAVAVLVVAAAVQLPRTRPRLPALPRDPVLLALLALLVVGAGFALVAALAPETEYDALWYHLDFPERHLAAGSLVDDRCEYVSLYPMGTELLFAYGLALEGAVVAKLVHYGFWVLLVVATFELGARVASRRAGLVAAVVAALTPTVLWEATTAYVDLAVGAFLTLSLSWTLRHLEDGRGAPLVIAGLMGGLAVAAKTLALIGLVPLALLVLARRGRPLRTRARNAALFGAVAVLPALPWFLRAEIEGGNPVFPSLHGLFGAHSDRWSKEAADALEASLDRWDPDGLEGLLSLPWDATMHASELAGSVGLAYLLLVPLAFGRGLPRGAWIVAAFALGYLVLWASPISSQQLRFVVPVVPALAVLAALGLQRAGELASGVTPRLGRAVAALALAVIALGLPPFTRFHERDGALTLVHVLRGAPVDVVTGAEGEHEYLERRLPAYAAARALSRVSGDGERVVGLTDPFVDAYLAPVAIPDYSACIALAGARPGDARSELRALRRLGVRYLLVQPDIREAQGSLAIVRAAPPLDAARRVYADERAVVYELLPQG